MQTPNTEAGRVTEDIMQEVLRRLPEITTGTYNPVYESVLAELEKWEQRNARLQNLRLTTRGAPHIS